MKESTNPVSSLSQQQRIELDMLHSVLNEDASYLWNPADPASTAYLGKLEEAFASGDLSEDVYNSQWSKISQQAEQLWSSSSPVLATLLIQRFESRMPAQVLTQLAAKAQDVSSSGLAVIDQLVNCAQDILAGWETDDLQVMARPLAFAMRDGHGEILDVALRSVRQTDWDNLSDLERARLTLAIARYALDEIAQEAES
ncbi:MAG: hypothetical protein AAGE59_17425 [Cyanobacteria bacterium P01_F01_bin.86]